MESSPVLNQILDHAQMLMQTRGYNAMSYRDVADAIGIKTSSVHYYFPSKEDLGRAVINRYRETFKEALAKIDAEANDPCLKFDLYVELFVNTVRTGRICLCGMFASDLMTLSESIKNDVKQFFSEHEAWLSNLLKAGRESGKFKFEGSPKIKAETIFSTLEGGMIAARLFNDEKRLLSAAKWIQSALSGK